MGQEWARGSGSQSLQVAATVASECTWGKHSLGRASLCMLADGLRSTWRGVIDADGSCKLLIPGRSLAEGELFQTAAVLDSC